MVGMMPTTKKKLLISGAVAGGSVVAWVAFRTYVRSETVRVLNTEYGYDEMVAKVSKLKTLGIDVNLPSASEFAESLVKTWDTTLPDKAFEDILKKGRKSEFWPENYRDSKYKKIEPFILKALSGAYYTPEGTDTKELSIAAGFAIAQELSAEYQKSKRR
jgi:hypothetical protein